MKLSVRWVFDHLKADYKKYDIKTIVQLLTSKTAEVEAYYPVTFDLKNQYLAKYLCNKAYPNRKIVSIKKQPARKQADLSR